MKSLIYVLIWTICFTVSSFYINDKIYDFTENYTSNVEIVGNLILDNDWDSANEELKILSKNWYEEKEVWYKLLDHTYFDEITLYLNILDKSIYTKDKSKAFEEIETIKMTLNNLLESEKFDLNHIF